VLRKERDRRVRSLFLNRLVSRSIYAPPMASAALSRRVGKVVAYPPLCEMSDLQRREFHEALLAADSFEDLPCNWQAATSGASGRAAAAC